MVWGIGKKRNSDRFLNDEWHILFTCVQRVKKIWNLSIFPLVHQGHQKYTATTSWNRTFQVDAFISSCAFALNTFFKIIERLLVASNRRRAWIVQWRQIVNKGRYVWQLAVFPPLTDSLFCINSLGLRCQNMFVYRQATADRCERHLIGSLVVKVIPSRIKPKSTETRLT